MKVNKYFVYVHLERVKGVWDRLEMSLWLQPVLWPAEAFNGSAASVNTWRFSLHEVFCEG